MTPNEITALLALKYGRVLDMPFKLALLKRVDVWRSRLIRNSLEKEVRDRKFFMQTIYVPMIKKKEVECELPVTLCDIAVSPTLPDPLRANSILFDFVGGINGSNPFYQTEPGAIQYLRKGRYTGRRVMYDWINNRISVYGNEILPMIRIDAVWDNPLDVAAFVCKPAVEPSDENCNFWEQPYPCTNEILQLIIQSIEQVDFKEKNAINIEEDIQVPVNPTTDT